MIFFNEGMLLLGSNHILNKKLLNEKQQYKTFNWDTISNATGKRELFLTPLRTTKQCTNHHMYIMSFVLISCLGRLKRSNNLSLQTVLSFAQLRIQNRLINDNSTTNYYCFLGSFPCIYLFIHFVLHTLHLISLFVSKFFPL